MTVNVEPIAVTDGWPMLYALKTGLYKTYGLNVTEETISAAGTGAAEAVQSGHLDFGTGAAEYAAVNAAGGNLKAVLTASPRFAFAMYAKNSIASVKDLAGKTLGVAGLTGSFDVSARLLFGHDGVNPSSVTYVNLSDITSVSAALLKGTVDSAVLIVGGQTQQAAADNKLHEIADLGTVTEPVFAAGVFVSQKFIQSNPGAVQEFVTATMVGIHEMLADEAKTISVINSVSPGAMSSADLKVAYEYFKKTVWPNGQVPTTAELSNLLPLLAESNAAMGKLNASSLIDPSFAQSAASKLGYGS